MMGLCDLPNELLFLISQELKISDLGRLVLCSRRLATLLTPAFTSAMLRSADHTALALHWSAAIGNVHHLTLLLENGPRVSIQGNKTIICRTPTPATPSLVEKLLDLGARISVSPSHYPALHWALRHGHMRVFTNLVEKGAQTHHRDVYSKTLLHAAAETHNISAVRTLLSPSPSQAQVAVRDHFGATPLHLAAGCEEIMHALLWTTRSQANVIDFCDSAGQTALHRAVEAGNLAVVKALVEAGADVDVEDYEGRKARDVGVECFGREREREVLLAYIWHQETRIEARKGIAKVFRRYIS
ncbi:ankyrin [Choiromyces venosus 120613-1]|uniref:Ankyrin n=1 Tax=Choiromyces venosus 120613-1 TaxID=1336337 RepID=A0A3N4JAY2_9PEZI|nr:ankyrin [Choiromyces venosus 120613-1]